MDFDYKIRVNEYGFYCVPDVFANRELPKLLAKGKVYEPNTIRLLCRMAGQGDVVAGGAFIGDFFPAISRALSEKARLYSFEPNPISFEAANMAIKMNNLGNVALSQTAVGAESGVLHLQIARKAGGTATAARAKIVESPDDGETTEVKVTTLDEMIPKSRKVSIIQLDIEEHEIPALEGAKRIIQSNKPMVVLEAEKRWQVNMYLTHLNEHFPKHNYRMCGAMERNVFFVPNL